MKQSLDHLPQRKRDDLAKAVAIVRRNCPVADLIILFGSYARGDWKETDLGPNQHPSDYDILVVVPDPSTATDAETWNRVERACEQAGLSTHVRVVPEALDYMNARLAEQHFFYVDVYNEGIVLHDGGTLRLQPPGNPSEAKRRELARAEYTRWFDRARRFYRYFEFGMSEQDYIGAAFQLHQATEAAFKTLLLVFSRYSPKEHYLYLLQHTAAAHCPAIADLFPADTEAHERAYRLLDYAYVGARYHPDYQISKEALDYLAGEVQKLFRLVEKTCTDKLWP
jgi:HEPN domain-containing protein/predicted nucleotidyltransferase